MGEDIDAATVRTAALLVAQAEALVITAGAGMGVDSGLPDFRGTEGFWNAYPAYRRLGRDFAQMANPRWFFEDPHLAWGFYGHRLRLYQDTIPHKGFSVLERWSRTKRCGAFVVTSNVDGQFEKAGFAPSVVREIHGSIHHFQCLHECGIGIFPAQGPTVAVDPETFRAADPLPLCPQCGALARPNILMFGDPGWDDRRSEEQTRNFTAWRRHVHETQARLLIIECGAGTAIPSIRFLSEDLAEAHRTSLIRINVRDPNIPPGPHCAFAAPARDVLLAIDACWNS